MPAPSYATIADNLLTAANEIITGALASYTYGGRTYTMLNVPELLAEEQKVRALANQASGVGAVITLSDMRSARDL